MPRKIEPKEKLSQLLKQLHLCESDWKITYDFTKSMLSSQRGVVVEVCSLKSGKKARKSVVVGSKNDARAKVVLVAKELLLEMIR